MRSGAIRIAAAWATLFVAPVASAQVEALAALHHDGQTFLTWTCPPGVGWIYRVYRSSSPIQSSADLGASTMLGFVADSTWCDRRLSGLCGTTYGYVVDSGAAPLDPTRGLFVWTADAPDPAWYAVTSQPGGQAEDRAVTPGGNSLLEPVEETPARPRPVRQRTLLGPYGMHADVYTLWTGDRGTPDSPAMANRPSVPYDCSVRRGGVRGSLLFHAHPRGGSFYLAQVGTRTPGQWVITMDDFIPTPEANTFWFGYHQDYDLRDGARSLPRPAPWPTTPRAAWRSRWSGRGAPFRSTRRACT